MRREASIFPSFSYPVNSRMRGGQTVTTARPLQVPPLRGMPAQGQMGYPSGSVTPHATNVYPSPKPQPMLAQPRCRRAPILHETVNQTLRKLLNKPETKPESKQFENLMHLQ